MASRRRGAIVTRRKRLRNGTRVVVSKNGARYTRVEFIKRLKKRRRRNGR